MKKIVVWLSISFLCVVVTSLETDAFMAIVACFDMLIVRENPARGRKEGTQGSVAILKEKTSKVVYLKTQIQWILFYGKLENWDWTLRRDTPEILRMHLVQNRIRERQGQSGGIVQKGWTSWATTLRTQFWEGTPEETSRQADCTSKVAWTLARKCASSSRRQLRFILLRRRQKHRRSYVWYGFGSFNAQCWARRFELR